MYDEYELTKLHNPYLCDIAYTLKKVIQTILAACYYQLKVLDIWNFWESDAIATFYGGNIKQEKLKDFDLTVITPKTLKI